MRRSIIIFAIGVLNISGIMDISANAVDFASPPPNISTFESQISQSVLEVSCGGVKSVGFAGNYTVTQEMKDNGQNSVVLTSAIGTQNCRNRGSGIPFTYSGKSYMGTINWWNGTEPDFANFTTSVNIPNIPLYGTDRPSPGWWVDVVQNIQGFGLVWRQSKVELYNEKTLKFTIDSVTPAVTDNALVFNNQGRFIGIVSSSQSVPIPGQVIIQGAPLQCGFDNQSTFSPTNCGKKAVDIWPQGSIPPPVSTTIAQSSNQEYLDVTAAISKVNIEIQKDIQNCKDIGSQREANVRQIIVSTAWWAKCSALSQRLAAVVTNSANNIKDVTASKSITSADIALQNSNYDEINSIGDDVSALIAALENSLDNFVQVGALVKLYSDNLHAALTSFSDDKDTVASLPAVLKSPISSSATYKFLQGNQEIVSKKSADFDAIVQDLQNIDNADSLDSTLSRMKDFSKEKSLTTYMKNADQLHSLIPSAYCKNGKKYSKTLKNGNCSKGWNLVQV